MKRKTPKKKNSKQLQLEDETKAIAAWREQAPRIKRQLFEVGFVSPFYDFLDSWDQEFHRIVREACGKYSCLLGVFELDQAEYDNEQWLPSDAPELAVLRFETEEGVDYEKETRQFPGRRGTNIALVNGHATLFSGSGNPLSVVVKIPKVIRCDFQHRENQYALKLASLCHELGHVHDAENRINFDLENRKLHAVNAEVFANLYALDMLAARGLYQTYKITLDGLKRAIDQPGYPGEVSRRVLKEHSQRDIVDWRQFFSSSDTPKSL